MKKIFASIFACVALVLGMFTFMGCEKDVDLTGTYKLVFALYTDNGTIVTYSEDEADTETYIKINGTTISEYTFKKSDDTKKVLINSESITHLTLPEFTITKEGKQEYFTNYTNLGRYDEATNQYKTERWTYVKVNAMPVVVQSDLVEYFGDYTITDKYVGGVRQSETGDVKLKVNGNITLTIDGVATEYVFTGVNNKIFTYLNGSTQINLAIINGRIKTSFATENADTDYNLFKKVEE